jgi:hypothetical protein
VQCTLMRVSIVLHTYTQDYRAACANSWSVQMVGGNSHYNMSEWSRWTASVKEVCVLVDCVALTLYSHRRRRPPPRPVALPRPRHRSRFVLLVSTVSCPTRRARRISVGIWASTTRLTITARCVRACTCTHD